MSNNHTLLKASRVHAWLWLAPMLYMLIVGLYFTARYSGRWSENDTVVLTQSIRAMLDEGTLVPKDGVVYSNGFSYQSISVFIIALTGVDVASLQQLFYPVVGFLLVIPIWLLYRELTEGQFGATLGTILLLAQPEFLFVVLRSSHEKFTRTLMIICLYLLVRSFKVRGKPWVFALYITLFYLSTLAFIASNNLLAHSFIFAVALALGLGWFIGRGFANVKIESANTVRRLNYVLITSLSLVYLFTFYIYAPAEDSIFVFRTIWDRIAALFLDVQQTSTISYQQVQAGWISLPVYFLVSIADWLILASSFILWISVCYNWFIRGKQPESQVFWLVWLLYTAFAAQGVLSIVADASGVLASNLQHRLFPSFSILAIAFVSKTIVDWMGTRRSSAWMTFGAIFCFSISILSVFKATNEPILSNNWTFYRSYELNAYIWADIYNRNATIWDDFNERLGTAFAMQQSVSENNNYFVRSPYYDALRTFIVTDVVRMRSTRLKVSLPVPYDAMQIYDNGDGQIYRKRPITPYQK